MEREQAIYNLSIYLQTGVEPPAWKSSLKLALKALVGYRLPEQTPLQQIHGKLPEAQELIDLSNKQTGREAVARWLRTYKLGEAEVEDPTEDGIIPWDKCSQETKSRWLKDANKLFSLLKPELLSDEEIERWLENRLGKGNRFEQFNRKFCKDLAQAQLDK